MKCGNLSCNKDGEVFVKENDDLLLRCLTCAEKYHKGNPLFQPVYPPKFHLEETLEARIRELQSRARDAGGSRLWLAELDILAEVVALARGKESAK